MLSIVIPAYNEEKRLAPTLHICQDYLSKHPEIERVIVVNDGSRDHTTRVFHESVGHDPRFTLVNLPQNKGKGFAVRAGIQAATSAYVLFTDSDLSTPITFAETLLNEAKNADVVIGSRKLSKSLITKSQPLYRRLISRVGDLVRKSFFLKNIQDTQCGFKLFDREKVTPLLALAHVNRYAFDIELLVIAQENKLRIKEVPVEWHHDELSKINISKAVFEVLSNILLIKKNQLSRAYRFKSPVK